MKRAENLAASFRYAWEGLRYAYLTQRNLRIHVVAAAFVLWLSWVLALAAWKDVAVLLAILVVMVAEVFNTALEAVVDLASPMLHPLAKVAKDVAAGAVLLASGGAAILGLWFFVPELSVLPQHLMLRLRESLAPTVLGAVLCLGILAVTIGLPRIPVEGGQD